VEWQSLPSSDTLEQPQSAAKKGLIQTDESRWLVQFGPDVLAAAQHRSISSILLTHFQSVIVAIMGGRTDGPKEEPSLQIAAVYLPILQKVLQIVLLMEAEWQYMAGWSLLPK